MVLPFNFGGIMTKYCNRCKSTKDISLFYKCSSKKDKKASHCKKCDNIAKNNWRKNNPEKVKAYEKGRWRQGNKRTADIERSRKQRLELNDSYVRELMTKKHEGLDAKDIPDELVQAYKTNLRLKRELNLTNISKKKEKK